MKLWKAFNTPTRGSADEIYEHGQKNTHRIHWIQTQTLIFHIGHNIFGCYGNKARIQKPFKFGSILFYLFTEAGLQTLKKWNFVEFIRHIYRN